MKELSQADIAQKIGKSRCRVQSIEAGKTKMQIDELIAVAKLLSVTIDKLILEPLF